MATITIDGKAIRAEEGANLLEAALEGGVYIPHLCHHPDLPDIGNCRLCLVEVDGSGEPVPSCMTKVTDGMSVSTRSERIDHIRRLSMELLLGAHPSDCSVCPKYGRCEFQTLIQYMAVSATRVHTRTKVIPAKEQPLFHHDMNRCVLCGRCVRACKDLRGVGVLGYNKRPEDLEVYVGTLHDRLLTDVDCRFCGACAEVCPTGAIRDVVDYDPTEKRDALIPCQHACPAHTDIPRYLKLAAEGRAAEADAVIRERLPFPGVLGHVCNHRCENECRRGEVNEPISICKVKRFVAANDEDAAWKARRVVKAPTGKTVAVIGAGPAGLTSAYYLAKQGHAVTLLESKPKAGGYMQYGIPAFRLPKDVVQHEVSDVLEVGVDLRCGVTVTNPRDLAQSYDAVVIAVGVSKGTRLRLDGANAEGTTTAIDLMESVNRGDKVEIGRRPFVIGGGSVGFDTARTLVRLGAEKVTLACLESPEQMKATPDEISEGREEGIDVRPSTNFVRIATEQGRVTGIETQDVRSFSFGPRGLELDVIEGSDKVTPADMIVFAVGQRAGDFDDAAAIERGRANTVVLAREGSALVKGTDNVFAAGDAVRGISFVIDAVASGRDVASEVDRFLGGDGDISEQLVDPTVIDPCIGRVEGFSALSRHEEVVAPAEERIKSFDVVAETFGCDAARAEASRCLQCELRFKIHPSRLWNSYAEGSKTSEEVAR